MLFFLENVSENNKKNGQPHAHQKKDHGRNEFNSVHNGLFKV
jgi:hypothetical protein